MYVNRKSFRHTKIKQGKLSFNNLEDKHDFTITYNDLYVTLCHNLSHLHIKQI